MGDSRREGMRKTLEDIQADDIRRQAHLHIGQLQNVLEQVRVALEEDDAPEEALRLVKEALGHA